MRTNLIIATKPDTKQPTDEHWFEGRQFATLVLTLVSTHTAVRGGLPDFWERLHALVHDTADLEIFDLVEVTYEGITISAF